MQKAQVAMRVVLLVFLALSGHFQEVSTATTFNKAQFGPTATDFTNANKTRLVDLTLALIEPGIRGDRDILTNFSRRVVDLSSDIMPELFASEEFGYLIQFLSSAIGSEAAAPHRSRILEHVDKIGSVAQKKYPSLPEVVTHLVDSIIKGDAQQSSKTTPDFDLQSLVSVRVDMNAQSSLGDYACGPRSNMLSKCANVPTYSYVDGTGATQTAECSITAGGYVYNYTIGPPQSGTDRVSCSCYQCDVGKFSAAGPSPDTFCLFECQACDNGKYTDVMGSQSCKNCPKGYTSGYKLTDSVVKDQSGKQWLRGVDSCSPCAAGKYAENEGSPYCTYCDVGTSSAAGSDSCTDCPPGKYAAVTSEYNEEEDYTYQLSICTPCDVGTYQAGSRATECATCPINNVARSSGSTSCSCGSGSKSYQVDASTWTCKQCPAGWYDSHPSDTDCTVCGVGSYQSMPGKTSCSPCSVATSQGASTCVCPSGSKLDPATGACNQCVPGKYDKSPSDADCTFCPVSYYQDQSAQDGCKRCNLATTEGFTSCQCQDGYKLSADGSCVACLSGWYDQGPSFAQCTQCPVGYYQFEAHATSCLKCDVATTVGSKSCPCPRGTKPNASGACVDCSAGSYDKASDDLTCTQCPAGKYQSAAKSTTCLSCQVATAPGSASCNCPDGKVVSSTGECVECNVGTYKSGSMTECAACPSGSYQPKKGSSSCSPCQNPSNNGAACLCAAGQKLSPSGRCDDCPVGTYSVSQTATSCTPCSSPNYQPSSGKSSCIECKNGVTGAQGATSCQCNPGYEMDGQYCTACTAGKHSSDGKACEACPNGKYSNSYATVECEDCGGVKTSTSNFESCQLQNWFLPVVIVVPIVLILLIAGGIYCYKKPKNKSFCFWRRWTQNPADKYRVNETTTTRVDVQNRHVSEMPMSPDGSDRITITPFGSFVTRDPLMPQHGRDAPPFVADVQPHTLPQGVIAHHPMKQF